MRWRPAQGVRRVRRVGVFGYSRIEGCDAKVRPGFTLHHVPTWTLLLGSKHRHRQHLPPRDVIVRGALKATETSSRKTHGLAGPRTPRCLEWLFARSDQF